MNPQRDFNKYYAIRARVRVMCEKKICMVDGENKGYTVRVQNKG